MAEEQSQKHPPQSEEDGSETSRRSFLAKLLMGTGLFLSYGLLAVQGVLFVLPPRTKVRTRKIFAGKLDHYKVGSTEIFYDLEGTPIMVKRDAEGLRAFSSVCPHLGCKVHWEDENHRFFCPCHGGVFTEDGVAIAGPPADAGQNLFEVPVQVDEASGIVYIEVKDAERRATT